MNSSLHSSSWTLSSLWTSFQPIWASWFQLKFEKNNFAEVVLGQRQLRYLKTWNMTRLYIDWAPISMVMRESDKIISSNSVLQIRYMVHRWQKMYIGLPLSSPSGGVFLFCPFKNLGLLLNVFIFLAAPFSIWWRKRWTLNSAITKFIWICFHSICQGNTGISMDYFISFKGKWDIGTNKHLQGFCLFLLQFHRLRIPSFSTIRFTSSFFHLFFRILWFLQLIWLHVNHLNFSIWVFLFLFLWCWVTISFRNICSWGSIFIWDKLSLLALYF